eukprot:1658516-Pleurochrysis_carterae.AAC.1
MNACGKLPLVSTHIVLSGGLAVSRATQEQSGSPLCDLVSADAPRSRQLLIAAGGGMTERPGAVADAGRAGKHARARAGTDLNAEVVHPWQFVDGEAHRRAARLLDWLPLWTIPFVGSFLPSAWLAKRHLWRRSEHSPPYMLLTSKAM